MPRINDNCIRCGMCIEECRHDAIELMGNQYQIDQEKCNNCPGCCCPQVCDHDAFEDVEVSE